ncbi:MAG: hypothetical protein WC947_10890 [Elusimicrobiota bacterium]
MENLFLVYLTFLIFIFFSAREKKWKLKRTIFLNLLFSIAIGFLFYKLVGDKHFILPFSLFSIGSYILGYFLRPIGEFFKKNMGVSHSDADNSDEEGGKDYRW